MRASLRTQRRHMLALALPAMGALALEPLLSLVDTALVGRLGRVPLAALGIDAGVFTTLMWLCNFLVYGTTSAVAHLYARGETESAATRVVQAAWLAVTIGVAMMAALAMGGPLILIAMGAQGEVHDAALLYLRIRALAAVPSLLLLVGHGAFRGVQDTRTPLRIAVAITLLNAAASWLLIYPLGLGIAGAAWGTVLAQAVGAVAMLAILRGRLPGAALAPKTKLMGEIMTVSRDLFLRTASLMAGLLLATAAATRMGVTQIAAHQIVREVWVLFALILDGFAIAAQALIATALGAGDRARAKLETAILLRWALGTGVVVGVVHMSVIGVLPAVFTDQTDVLAQARSVWFIVALLQPIGALVFVLDGVFMGAHDYRYLFVWTAVASLLVLAPVSFLALQQGWGLQGIWAGMAGLLLVRLVSLLARLRHFDQLVDPPAKATT